MAGVGGAQLILFSFQFITRRLYDPEVFGVFDVYFNVLLVLLNISCLRYEMAIILPKKRKLAFNILALTFLSSLIINLIVFILLIAFKDQIFNLLSVDKKYFTLFLLLPLVAFISSFYQSVNNLLIRLKLFKSSSFNRILRRVFEGSSQLVLGKMKFKSGLILGDLVGNLTIFAVGIFQLFKNGFSLQYISSKKIKYVFKKYLYLPKYNLVPHILNIFSSSLPIILINIYYGSENAGYYGLARTVLLIPTSLIGSSVSKVLMQRIALNRNQKKSVVGDIMSILYLISIPTVIVIIILFLWSEPIFSFAFGDTWLMSGNIARIFIIPFALQFLVSPISIVFIALEKIKLQSVWQILYFLSIISLVLFKGYSYNDYLKILALIYAVAYTVYGIFTFTVVYNYEMKLKESDA